MAHECIDLVRPGTTVKQLALSLHVEEDVPQRVLADVGRVRQILLNLLSNAIKFTAAGAVSLRVSCPVGADGADALRFEVGDTGIGLSPKQIGSLFQAFTQADISTTRRFGGTGLGLSIAKRLVELMGGTIGVESRMGEGSTFWLHLPLKVGTAIAPAVAAGPPESFKDLFAGSNLRVLLADDVVTNQMVGRGLLAQLGLDADAVSNGAEAVAALERLHYDLVLMDVHMPEMDGMEATRRIREHRTGEGKPGARLPIIALTASAMPGDRQRYLEAGMDDFLSKPIMPAELVAAMRKWLPAEWKAAILEPEPVALRQAVCVFDREGLLGRVMGDAQLANAVMEGYAYDMPQHVAALAQLVHDHANLEEVADLAHRIRGASATVGGETVRAITEEMEMAGRAADRARAEAACAGLAPAFEQLMKALGAERAELLAA